VYKCSEFLAKTVSLCALRDIFETSNKFRQVSVSEPALHEGKASRQDMGSYWKLTRAKCVVRRRKPLKKASADSPMHRARCIRWKVSKRDSLLDIRTDAVSWGAFQIHSSGGSTGEKEAVGRFETAGKYRLRKRRKWPVERRVQKQIRAIFDENCSLAVSGVRKRNPFQCQIAGKRCSRRHRGIGTFAVRFGGNRQISCQFECTKSRQLGSLAIISWNRNSVPYRLSALSVTVESRTVESGKESGKTCCEFRATVTSRRPTARKETPINKDINSLW
jgi:hypothetical protein